MITESGSMSWMSPEHENGDGFRWRNEEKCSAE